ncbi:carboxypeptidase-like regulatory domain-containing protein [Candidatus Kryptonium thompsonii]|uniref:carboxypeptidase-like regulatory domain-containing protein n=1 Tax=Candidatus Kryptonium thompsonii TaxID=1633631 RepID=UPI00063E86EB|nr:carboxypeptidase-like regulatory domain-containing protein [Candidatus Kryptonium thompsoni]CUS99912.1 Carboxypeptidase regulatory-like domain-containing protein [Candidatus Kryptonium thompsoni]
MRYFKIALISLLSLILLTSLTLAQGSGAYTASVTGKIVDNEGKPIPDVEVIAKNVETGYTRGAITTAGGIYNILSVPPGTYEISALHIAYGKQTKVVELGVGERVTVNFTLVSKELQVGEVVVTAEALDYEVKKAELSVPLRPQQISASPFKSRFFFLKRSPSVKLLITICKEHRAMKFICSRFRNS